MWKEAPRLLFSFSVLAESVVDVEVVVVEEVGLRIESKARGAAVARRLTGLRMVVVAEVRSDDTQVYSNVCLVLI